MEKANHDDKQPKGAHVRGCVGGGGVSFSHTVYRRFFVIVTGFFVYLFEIVWMCLYMHGSKKESEGLEASSNPLLSVRQGGIRLKSAFDAPAQETQAVSFGGQSFVLKQDSPKSTPTNLLSLAPLLFTHASSEPNLKQGG